MSWRDVEHDITDHIVVSVTTVQINIDSGLDVAQRVKSGAPLQYDVSDMTYLAV